MKTSHAIAAILACAAGAGAAADETQIRMKEAPETPTLIANCSSCHSLDYIQMNSRFMKRAGWEAEVHKMVAVMGAPVSETDQAALVEYLTREYGVTE